MSKLIDLEMARHIRDANETLDDIVETMNGLSEDALFELHQKELKELFKDDPTITLAETRDQMDCKSIYLRTKIGVSQIYSYVGLHAIGYAGPYEYEHIDLDQRRTKKTSNFNALETWGNEYDGITGQMIGRGSFRLHTHDIEEYAKEMESEGWERCEKPGVKK